MFNAIFSFFSGLGNFLKSFAKTTTGQLVEELGDLAYDVVTKVEQQSSGTMSGSAKIELAKSILITEATKAGIAFTRKAINSALEVAVGILADRGEEIKDCETGDCE